MYLLFDIGGTKTRLAASDGYFIDHIEVLETPQNFDEAIPLLGRIAHELSDEKYTLAVGGLAGALSEDKKGLFDPPNLPGWHGRNFVEGFSSYLNAPVTIENDTALVGLGEAVEGAGKGFSIVMYMTISTGVNAVKIHDKRIDENTRGFETGKQIIDIASGATLESFISGSSLTTRFQIDPYEIEDRSIWEDVERIAATGVFNSVLHWSPEVVVLGGGITQKLSIENINKHFSELVDGVFPSFPKIVRAELGDRGGLAGALQIIRNSK